MADIRRHERAERRQRVVDWLLGREPAKGRDIKRTG
jgi:hypothetical protein